MKPRSLPLFAAALMLVMSPAFSIAAMLAPDAPGLTPLLWLRDPHQNFDPMTGVWSDSSGNGNDASPVGTVAGTGITYVAPTLTGDANAAVFAPTAVGTVLFGAGVNDLLQSTAINGGAGLSELTMFTVYRVTPVANDPIAFARPAGLGSETASGGVGGADRFNLASDPSVRKDNGQIGAGAYSQAHPTGTLFLRVTRMDAGGVDEWFNSAGTLAPVLTNRPTAFTISTDDYFLGDLRSGATAVNGTTRARFDIAVAETIVYNTSLDIMQVEDISEWIAANIGQPPLNLALAGSATQSTTLTTNTADRAIDDAPGTFTHTLQDDTAPWWQVDLGQTQTIEQIRLINRQACCQSRLRDITVEILAADGTTPLYTSPLLNPENVLGGGQLDIGPAALDIDLLDELGGPVFGRFVKVLRTPDPNGSGVGEDPGAGIGEPSVLSLAEVQVFGQVGIVPEPTSLMLLALGVLLAGPGVVWRRRRG